ncbi:ngoBVM, partial [Symbiodinium necroappetens]
IVRIGKNKKYIGWGMCTLRAGPPRQRGLLDLWNMKLDILDHLIGPFLTGLKLPDGEVKALLDAFDNHETFRATLKNKSWQGALSDAGRKLSDLISGVVYGVQQDGVLKTTLKGTVDPKEFLSQCPLMQASMGEISDLAKKAVLGHSGDRSAADPLPGDAADPAEEDFSLDDLVDKELLQKDDGTLQQWKEFAANLVDQFVTIVSDDLKVATMDWATASLSGSILSKIEGRALFLYDIKIAGEASSNPNSRPPSFRNSHLKRGAQTFVVLREDKDHPNDINPKDVILVLDAGKSGNETAIASSLIWTDGSHFKKDKSVFHIVYSEDSLNERRAVTRGIVQQDERMYMFTSSAATWKLEKVSRKHYDGSSWGSVISQVTALSYDSPDMWKLPPSEKAKLYGTDGAVFVGGPCPNAAPKPDNFKDVEPVSWHPSHPHLLDEILHCFKPSVVFRYPEVDHVLAIQCLAAKIPVVLVVFTPHHAVLLKKQILQQLWKKMTDPKCTELFEIGLARIVNKEPVAVEDQEGKGKKRKAEGDGETEIDPSAKQGRGRGRGRGGRAAGRAGGRPGVNKATTAAAEKARQLLLSRLQGKTQTTSGNAGQAMIVEEQEDIGPPDEYGDEDLSGLQDLDLPVQALRGEDFIRAGEWEAVLAEIYRDIADSERPGRFRCSCSGSFTMGSAFSGLGSDFFAMKRLGKRFSCCFWAECNPSCQTVLHESHKEHISFSDIRSPDFALAPSVTLFTAGFPCQPYSKAGPSLGTSDAGMRGTLVYYVLRYLAHQHPDTFVLENVPGLLQQRHSGFLEMVLRVLTSLVDARGKYDISWQKLNACHHGIPQNRERLFIAGVLKSQQTRPVQWPAEVPMPNVEHYLEKHIGGGDRLNKGEEKKLSEAMAEISKRGLGHGKGFWIVSRKRFTTLREKLWLTGLTEDELPLDIVSKAKLGEMLGNSVPIPLMAAVLSAVLAAIS